VGRAAKSTLDLAQELVRVNKAKVDRRHLAGRSIWCRRQAEVAADQEQLIIAETSVKEAEDRLRPADLSDTGNRESWNTAIRDGRFAAEYRDAGPSISRPAVTACRWVSVPILVAGRRQGTSRTPGTNVPSSPTTSGSPTWRVNGSYQASGLGRATQILRSGGFPGTILGPGTITPVGDVPRPAVSAHDYPTWAVGISLLVPDLAAASNRRRTTRRGAAWSSRRPRPAAEKRAEGARHLAGPRRSLGRFEMNAKRIETTRSARRGSPNSGSTRRTSASRSACRPASSTIQAQRRSGECA